MLAVDFRGTDFAVFLQSLAGNCWNKCIFDAALVNNFSEATASENSDNWCFDFPKECGKV